MSKSDRKIYRIKLTAEEREGFVAVSKAKRGKLSIAKWKVQRAIAMLKCDEEEVGPGWSDERISESCGVTARSLENWQKQAFERGLLSLLERKQRSCLRRLRFSTAKKKLCQRSLPAPLRLRAVPVGRSSYWLTNWSS